MDHPIDVSSGKLVTSFYPTVPMSHTKQMTSVQCRRRRRLPPISSSGWSVRLVIIRRGTGQESGTKCLLSSPQRAGGGATETTRAQDSKRKIHATWGPNEGPMPFGLLCGGAARAMIKWRPEGERDCQSSASFLPWSRERSLSRACGHFKRRRGNYA